MTGISRFENTHGFEELGNGLLMLLSRKSLPDAIEQRHLQDMQRQQVGVPDGQRPRQRRVRAE